MNMKADMSKRGNDLDGFFITKPQEVINIDSNNIYSILYGCKRHIFEDNKYR